MEPVANYKPPNRITDLVSFKEQGLEVVIPDKNAFREMVKPVVQELKAGWAPGLYEEYVKPLLEE